MDNLWASWRRDFILGPREKGCVFCNRIKRREDRENLILYRAKKNIVIMNKYPYNAGHLMVVPKRHKGDLAALTPAEANEFFELTRKSVTILKATMPVDGFNVGLNLGADAGAGIRDHIHIHIVPRFKGDTNFISVLSDVKLQSISMLEIYDMLRPGFDRLRGRS
jgi:ATP adenylyltransferase